MDSNLKPSTSCRRCAENSASRFRPHRSLRHRQHRRARTGSAAEPVLYQPTRTFPAGARATSANCRFEPGSVDAVITDIPWEIGWLPTATLLAEWCRKVLVPDGVLVTWLPHYHLDLSIAESRSTCITSGPSFRPWWARTGTRATASTAATSWRSSSASARVCGCVG